MVKCQMGLSRLKRESETWKPTVEPADPLNDIFVVQLSVLNVTKGNYMNLLQEYKPESGFCDYEKLYDCIFRQGSVVLH